jgi:hypothetical protein
LEYGKFVELQNDARFPPISVVHYEYPDMGTPGVSSLSIYPKTALITYLANASDINLVLSASEVDIGNVGVIDKSTGNDVFAQITQIATVGLTRVGAVTVKTFGVTPVSGSITNTVAISTTQTLPVSVVNPSVNIKQAVTNWDVLTAAINDSTYTTLPSNPANEITILNNTGVYIFVKNSAKSLGIQIANNTSIDLNLVGNTNEVAIQSNSGNKTVYATFVAYS